VKRFINIVVLLVFLLGTIPYSVILKDCKIFDMEDLQMTCYCEAGLDGGVYFNSIENLCCETKTFEKGKVNEFSISKDEVVKVISTSFIPSDFLPKFERPINFSLFYSFKPLLGLKIPLMNCSLLI